MVSNKGTYWFSTNSENPSLWCTHSQSVRHVGGVLSGQELMSSVHCRCITVLIALSKGHIDYSTTHSAYLNEIEKTIVNSNDSFGIKL